MWPCRRPTTSTRGARRRSNCIGSLQFDVKLIPRAVFHNTAAFERVDCIGTANGRQAMRHEQDRRAAAKLTQGALDQSSALRIERTGRFVKDEKLWLPK